MISDIRFQLEYSTHKGEGLVGNGDKDVCRCARVFRVGDLCLRFPNDGIKFGDEIQLCSGDAFNFEAKWCTVNILTFTRATRQYECIYALRQSPERRVHLLQRYGMRDMQERAYERRGEQYLLIKSPPASRKSRALIFIALDKLENQGLKQAIVVVPEKSIGSNFNDEPLAKYGF